MKKIFTAFLFITLPCVHLLSEENFLIINGMTNEVVMELGSHLDERATPACSFNIALSLMAYDAGVLKDEEMPVLDFQEGYDDFSESWKEFQTPKSWMARSCLWYSKLIALELGLETMQSYLALLEYGNQDMSAGLALPGDMSPPWVGSSLLISPREQAQFIQKMIQRKFSVSENAVQMTKALTFKEELLDGWKLYGKTGLAMDDFDLKVRWFAGWIEKDQAFFPFAYQLHQKEMDVSQTVPRVKQLLSELPL